ncbi:MAG: response regulator, partial [Kiritimatiellae bacterium]|nr:response regulator [Kiritimatiellia bacterium]
GQTAEAASSGEALARLRREAFDLVLTDMKMPGMDGGAFIRALREDPKLRALPVFLVTADIEALKYYKALGADGVLLKPVVQARLAETLSGICVKGEG